MPDVTDRPYSYRHDPAVPAFDDARALFVFDGVCVLCSGGASRLMRIDRKRRVNFTPVDSPLSRALCRHYRVDPNKTYLLVAGGRAFTKTRG